MTRLWAVMVVAGFGRLVAIAGASLSAGAIIAYVSAWAISAIRVAPDWNVGLLPVVCVLQVGVAGWVVWGALKASPRRLLLNVLVAFAATFLLGYGWYFLLASMGGDPVPIGNLLYLAAALPLAAAVMAARALGNEQEEELVNVPGEQVSRGVRMSARAIGAIAFLALATAVGYQTLPPLPPEDPAVSPPQRPSCPGYLDKEVAAFEGRGSRTTPAFEVSGYWGMENASTGYGTISWTVVDEEGDAPYGTEGPFGAGNSVGGGEYAHGGTLRLKIEADDDARYAVVICEGEDPIGGGQDKPG